MTDAQTDRQADRNAPLPYRGGVLNINITGETGKVLKDGVVEVTEPGSTLSDRGEHLNKYASGPDWRRSPHADRRHRKLFTTLAVTEQAAACLSHGLRRSGKFVAPG